MKYLVLRLVTIISFIWPHGVYGADWKTYKVHHGDILGRILLRESLTPLYGKSGFIAKTIQLNSSLGSQHGNRLYPGQIIVLPIDLEMDEKKSFLRLTASPQEQAPAPVIQPEEPLENAKQELASSIFPTDALMAEINFRYSRFDVTSSAFGTRLEALSDLDPGVSLGYKVKWNSRISTLLKLNYQRFSLKEVDQGFSLDGRSGNLLGFGLDLQMAITDRLIVLTNLNLEDELLIEQSSAQTFQTYTTEILQPSLGFEYTFYQPPRISLGGGSEFTYLSPSSAGGRQIHAGNRWGAFLFLNREIKSNLESAFRFKLSYENEAQDTDFSKHANQSISLSAILDWGL